MGTQVNPPSIPSDDELLVLLLLSLRLGTVIKADVALIPSD